MQCYLLARARCVFAATLMLAGAEAYANGLYESRSWQFDTTFDRAQKASVQNLIELKKAGAYKSFNNYDIDYNIEGDYINCAVSSSAIGNQQSLNQDAPIGSPSITVDPGISSSTVGNSNTSDVVNDSSGALRVASADVSGSFSELGNDGSASWTGSQTNTGSNLSSGVDSSSIATSIGSTSGSGGGGYAALNSSQGNTGTSIASSVSGSNACAFTPLTGVGN